MAGCMLVKIDRAGRIVLPKDLRDAFGYIGGTPINFCVHDQAIILQRARNECAFCGSQCKLHKMHDEYVCENCIRDTYKK